jgi:putative membrane protein
MRLLPRLAVAAVTGALALAVAAPAQAAVPTRHQAPAATGATAGHGHDGGDLCRQDRRFLVRAHQANLAEIIGGHLALARSGDDEVRRIARMLITDHRRLDADVRTVARRYDVTLPPTPSPAQLRQLLAVAVEPDRTFDRAWLRLQEVSHLRTLALIRAEVHRGCSPAVRQLARAAAPAVRHHLEMVRDALYG